MSISERIQLILARVEILKLMADDYIWQCHTPQSVKNELIATLDEINSALAVEVHQK